VRIRLLLAALAIVMAAGIAAPPRLLAQDDESEAPRITQAQFKKLLAQGQVLVVDVRGKETYQAGHIPGAISIPLDEVKANAARLKAAAKPIVTYCA
jgi:3-mercaptopyruvate sulfurtransferase SseA